MSQDRSRTILIGIGFIIFVLILYCWSSYNSIFDRRVAYIYHPSSDRIFKIEQAPSLYRYKKWEPFIPFHSLFYGGIDGAHYIGALKNVLAEVQADRRLIKENPEAWGKKQRFKMETLIQEAKDGDIEFWDIKYFVRLDIAPETLLPDSMSDLRKYSKDRPSNLLSVDAIVSRWTMTGKRPVLELLEGALLIQGRAAYEVSDRGL